MKVNKTQLLNMKKHKVKTREDYKKQRLKNQRILVGLLKDFTNNHIQVNLELNHLPLVSSIHQFSFHMNSDDFLKLYNGTEVQESQLGLISKVIYEDSDEISHVKVYAVTSVRARKFDTRQVLLTASVLEGK